MPFRRLVEPFRGCFGAPNSGAEPVTQVNNQVLHSASWVVHNCESGPPPWHSLQTALQFLLGANLPKHVAAFSGTQIQQSCFCGRAGARI